MITTMESQMKFLMMPILLVLFILLPCSVVTHAKSMIEPCSSSDSCTSLLSYILPYDSKLSEIAYRFQLNISDILAANSINPRTPSLDTHIFHAKSFFKIPIMCPCVDGIRRSISTIYTVKPADTLESISESYGGLVTGQQIGSTNNINAMNPLMIDQPLVIPLPCTCFNNVDNGIPAVYMSYVVQNGESFRSIATEFGTTVTDLAAVNGFGQLVLDPGDILAIPIPACSSANLNWHNESLIVPNGSYALTASNCIKCVCRPDNLQLQCSPSGIVASCTNLQCKDSDLFIGDSYVNRTNTGCNVTTCVYRGHLGGKIFRSLQNSSQVQCPGNQNFNAIPPMVSPYDNPHVPCIGLPPQSSPAPAPSPTMGRDDPYSQKSNIPSDKKELLNRALWYNSLLVGAAFVILF
ncbi:hypothetical protein Tsubulata_039107 [Turnera subulata]|uniref:LysM domain-containing protein n=1 Tax=Turnera subulata TaxID=218843 RepID=A0A9Q0J288_9ROSI|nr:hypothetical protein Tsubulata_039107 [Turnera subulata]